MENIRLEYEVSRLRGDVVFVGAAIVGALVINAYILIQIANDLHCVKEIEKRRFKQQIPPEQDEFSTTTDQVQDEQEVKEQSPAKETKTESETKAEDEKQ